MRCVVLASARGANRMRFRVLKGGTVRLGVIEEVLLAHLESLYSLARRMTKDPDAAADLVQDTAIRALERFHQLRNTAAALSWLTRILTTTFLDRHVRR